MLSDGIHLHLRAKPDLGSWKTSMTKLHPYTIEELIARLLFTYRVLVCHETGELSPGTSVKKYSDMWKSM